MATFTPVDYDPFASATPPSPPAAAEAPALPQGDLSTADVVQRMPKFTPVDHDPFARIDFNRPVHEVRADFAKIPEGPERDDLMKQWADHYVAKEREAQKAQDTGLLHPKGPEDIMRNVARGTLIGNFADEANAATSAALHKITGGKFGAPFDETVAYNRARDRASDAETPLINAATQLVGAFGTGAPVAKFVMGGKNVGLLSKTLRSGAAGTTAGYIAGVGQGEGDLAQRHDYATSGEGQLFGMSPTAVGALFGFGLPPALATGARAVRGVHDFVSPTLARANALLGTLPERIGLPHLSADGGGRPAISDAGAQAAAEQMLANQLARAGKTPDDLRRVLQQNEEARYFNSSSRAQDATAPVEWDPSLGRLAASAMRNNPEAANIGNSFQYARQTGRTPQGGLPDSAGIPHRPLFAEPMTGREAEKTFGTRFGTQKGDIVPMGQGERIFDAFKRALGIEDAKLHGHDINAYRTDQAILGAAKAEAQPAYRQLYDTGQNISIAPEVGAALQKWAPDGERLMNESEPVKRRVKAIVDLFAPKGQPISNIEKFDKTKQYLDPIIENLLKPTSSTANRKLAEVLTELKTDLLTGIEGPNGTRIGGVDNVAQGGLGKLYNETRGKWSSRMESREALQAGRDAWAEESPIGLDAYKALTEGKPGHDKLFRLGLHSAGEAKAKGMDRAADKTQLFKTPNIEELLSGVIPRSEGKGDVFANRPERFGQYLEGEKRAIQTRNMTQGGSPTARNLADDDAYNAMAGLGEKWQKIKDSSSIPALAIKAAEAALNKIFGMRADTSAEIARQLFSANPAHNQRVLRGIEARLGANRTEQFVRLMEQHQRQLTAAGARQGALPAPE